MNNIKEQMRKTVVDFRLPRYAEITNVGLYLEQTVKFVNTYLTPLGYSEITTSMVSNYVKQKLIESPVQKQYSAEHIAYLMFIAITKSVFSMEDLKMMIDIQKRTYSIEKAYDYICDKFENCLKAVFGISGYVCMTRGDDEENADEKIMLRSAIVSVVNKIYLNKYLAAVKKLNSAK